MVKYLVDLPITAVAVQFQVAALAPTVPACQSHNVA